ncbi:MAG: UUP1 family membrane protein [Alphaproteobacteria bacterium]|nr:UUP1 family membrane protein [Alphaproteobacteria bacterium]
MLQKFKSIRVILSIGLILSAIFAGYCMYYKVTHWGFSFKPRETKRIWNIEAHINFMPTNENIKITLATPEDSKFYKILDDNVIAPKYKVSRIKSTENKIVLRAQPQTEEQNLYYRILLFDNEAGKGTVRASKPRKPAIPEYDETQMAVAKSILAQAEALETEADLPQKIIEIFNEKPTPVAVSTLLPFKITKENVATTIKNLLAIKSVPSRLIKGVRLEENKKSFSPDLMIEAYVGGKWRLYNLKNAAKGMPDDFIIFQRGDKGLLDIEGGENSSIQFSVLRSTTSNFDLANHRARLDKTKSWYDNSIYNLPINNQNIIKWLSVFPLAILVIVFIRNIVGLQTMGTFTPMLIAMSLTQTGFVNGITSFAIIISIGMLLRTLLSRLNLLLVPRISSVVIFVIIIMQTMTIIGYRMNFDIGLSAVFFPIIIMAWIIERASITWEEDGAFNASREIFNTLLTSVVTYFIIQDEYIKHLMFAFNELNLVILFIVMLLGTYTGYRLLELKRFAPLVKRG